MIMNFESQVIILSCIKYISILITIIFKYYVDKASYDVLGFVTVFNLENKQNV